MGILCSPAVLSTWCSTWVGCCWPKCTDFSCSYFINGKAIVQSFYHKDLGIFFTRPQGIMLQIFLIMLFRISLKIPHYACSLLFFYARHYYYYSIVPIANNAMHKVL